MFLLLSLILFLYFGFSLFFFFLFFFCFALFSFFLSVFSISLVYRFSLPFFFLFSAMHIYDLLYCLPLQDLSFSPLNHFWPFVGVLPRLLTGLLVAQPPPLHCVGCATPHPQTKVVLFCFLLPLTLTSR